MLWPTDLFSPFSTTECFIILCFLSPNYSASSCLLLTLAPGGTDLSENFLILRWEWLPPVPFSQMLTSMLCGTQIPQPQEFPLMEPLQCEKSKDSVGSQWQLSGLISENVTLLDPGRLKRQHMCSSAFLCVRNSGAWRNGKILTLFIWFLSNLPAMSWRARWFLWDVLKYIIQIEVN